MLGITPLLDRYPRQLSGGQRQRVAIGRAIVRNPQLFLFDEPLSNLDAQLRDEMRGEIKRLHQEIATTMIYVTHDQIEAMTLADRIVLMRDGLIEQQGAPLDLFERPATRFVAGFLGSPRMSFLPGTPRAAATARHRPRRSAPVCGCPCRSRQADGASDGRAVLLGLRPEHMTARARRDARAGTCPRVDATIELIQPTGSRSYATFRLGRRAGHGRAAGARRQPARRADADRHQHRRRAIALRSRADRSAPDHAIAENPSVERIRMVKLCRHAKSVGTTVPRRTAPDAGPLSVELDNGALRYVRVGGVEVLRAIAFLVRDENWGTFTPAHRNLVVDQRADGFSVSYRGTLRRRPAQTLVYDATITGTRRRQPRLRRASPRRIPTSLTNRTGFVVLHPLEGVAGRPVEVAACRRRDGAIDFPDHHRPGAALPRHPRADATR